VTLGITCFFLTHTVHIVAALFSKHLTSSLYYVGFSFCYLMMLSVTRQYSVNDRMINENGAVGGTKIGRGNQSTWRKPASMPYYPPQIPHDLTWDQTWAAVGRNW
jgi:hypothetical protein